MKAIFALILLVGAVSAGPALSQLEPRLPLLPKLPLAQTEGRITNGDLASTGQFPYQAGLSLKAGKNGYWCGGTVISDRWILTAAHCTDGVDNVEVYLGATDMRNEMQKGQQRIFVSKSGIIVHEGWDRAILANDISLIKLPVKIQFDEFIQPATLPKIAEKYSTYEGDTVWASGWGLESDSSNTVSQFLRYIQVPVMKQSACNRFFAGSITDKMICISTKGKKSTCQGDSGGPLVYKDGETNYVIGATSFGIAFGCEIGWPGVFTRVTSYLDWIAEKTGVVNK